MQGETQMPNPVMHFEIGCRDLKKSRTFYEQLFQWKMEQFHDVHLIAAAEKGIGGHISSLGHEPHNYTLVYVEVDDIDKYLERAAALDGKKVVPKTEVPDMGWFAWFADPEGTLVGLWTSR